MFRMICLWISIVSIVIFAPCTEIEAQLRKHRQTKSITGAVSRVSATPNEKILDIQYKNPTYDTSSQTWAKSVCSDGVWLHGSTPHYEWMPILNSQLATEDRAVAVTGMAINPHQSGNNKDFGDVWFTHPFGSDWNFDVVWESNPNYDYLVAPRLKPDEEQDKRAIAALQTGLTNPRAIHVEMDSGLIPPYFRADAGDSVAVFGRWVVDCGHDNYQSEIHPPLMFVKASAGKDGISTRSTVISRPFLVSQEFEGGGLYDHLIKEIGKVAGKSLIPTPIPVILNDQLTARPKILTVPFTGIHWLTYLVRPPIKSPANNRLLVSYHFTVRTGVAVQIYNVGDTNGTIMVTVVFNDASYKPAVLPAKNNWHISLDEIGDHENLEYYLKGVQKGATNLIGNPYLAAVMQKGVDTDRYQLPTFIEPPDTKTNAKDFRNNTQVIIDDTQPFPIRGSVEVRWVTDPRTIIVPPKVNPRTVRPPK